MVGDPSDRGVDDLLSLLALRRQTGRPTVATADVLVHLYLAARRLARTVATDPALRLGEHLVRLGALDADRLRAALGVD